MKNGKDKGKSQTGTGSESAKEINKETKIEIENDETSDRHVDLGELSESEPNSTSAEPKTPTNIGTRPKTNRYSLLKLKEGSAYQV